MDLDLRHLPTMEAEPLLEHIEHALADRRMRAMDAERVRLTPAQWYRLDQWARLRFYSCGAGGPDLVCGVPVLVQTLHVQGPILA